MFIIISGNPVEGFRYEGPYATRDDAIFAGDDFGGDWWVAPLAPVNSLKEGSH